MIHESDGKHRTYIESLKTGDLLVCPKCLKTFTDCEDHPAYHNRTNYICPHCGYDGDSIEFNTNYTWHPINKE